MAKASSVPYSLPPKISEEIKEWVTKSVASILLSYSEWLDAELRLLCKPTKDDRTHEDLVNEFLASRNA